MRLTPGELKVMQLLWEHGEQKPAELQDKFPEPIKNPALRSYLSILLEKGHVTRRREGKVFLYKAKTKRSRAFREMLGELAEAFCDGSTQSLLLELVRSERLSESDIEELRQHARRDRRR